MRRSLGRSLTLWGLAVAMAGASAEAWGAEDYVLGHGLNIGDFNVAGYANVTAEAPLGRRKSLLVDDLSLFVSGHVNRWINPFVETELAGLPIVQSHGNGDSARGRLVLERLYNDFLFTDAWSLRVGKMLTPVGEWNQIHAAPLVTTTTRPLVTRSSFSEYTTGLSLQYGGDSGWLPETQIYAQPGHELAARAPEMIEREYRKIYGAHLNWPVGLTDKVGASLQHSEIVGSHQEQTLVGANAKLTFGRFGLEGEATYTSIDNPAGQTSRPTEWGGYLLGSYALTDTVSLFSWYEHFQARNTDSAMQDVLGGLSWRPNPATALKLEYLGSVAGSGTRNRTGWYASYSVLF